MVMLFAYFENSRRIHKKLKVVINSEHAKNSQILHFHADTYIFNFEFSFKGFTEQSEIFSAYNFFFEP